MAATFDKLTTPADAEDYRIDTGHRKIGLGSGLVGLMIAMAVVIIGPVAANELTQGDEETVGELVAIGFGLNTLALATLKVGIAIVLIGILVRLFAAGREHRELTPGTEGGRRRPDHQGGRYRNAVRRRHRRNEGSDDPARERAGLNRGSNRAQPCRAGSVG